ncbi:protein YgfX [Legionella jordanis]|uniref:protein YgfX n=1 Tax=Legionella jordanis TaxID=456 RepID=UPI0035C82D7A
MRNHLTRNWSILLNSLNCKLKLDKSFIFLRLVLLVYGVAFFIVFNTNWFVGFKCSIFLLLALSLLRIILQPIPYPNYQLLFYDQKKWWVQNNKGQINDFEELRVLMTTGLFHVISLTKPKHTTRFIIFSDQISPDMYRLLRIQEKFLGN